MKYLGFADRKHDVLSAALRMRAEYMWPDYWWMRPAEPALFSGPLDSRDEDEDPDSEGDLVDEIAAMSFGVE